MLTRWQYVRWQRRCLAEARHRLRLARERRGGVLVPASALARHCARLEARVFAPAPARGSKAAASHRTPNPSAGAAGMSRAVLRCFAAVLVGVAVGVFELLWRIS